MQESQLWSSEQLVLCHDDRVGLDGVIAIDDSTLGPGLGGVRLKSYPDRSAAITECQRLARTMTLKNALAELPYGGAKAVIVSPPEIEDREALILRFGEFLARLGGAYIPGVDMGTSTEDLALMATTGAEVSCSQEDPSPWTALGVAAAIRAAVAHRDGSERLDGLTVLVQGVGHVGAALARELAADGARLLLADIDTDRVTELAEELDAIAIAPEDVLTTRCDVFAPCAGARQISAATVSGLDCRIIAGAANDLLAEDRCAVLLAEREITYVPDFLTNAGGVIHIHALRAGWSNDHLQEAILAIGERSQEVLEEASNSGSTPLVAAQARARERIRAATLPLPGAIAA